MGAPGNPLDMLDPPTLFSRKLRVRKARKLERRGNQITRGFHACSRPRGKMANELGSI